MHGASLENIVELLMPVFGIEKVSHRVCKHVNIDRRPCIANVQDLWILIYKKDLGKPARWCLDYRSGPIRAHICYAIWNVLRPDNISLHVYQVSSWSTGRI